jgi:predicted SprT family Zn-dependent metalloprotease
VPKHRRMMVRPLYLRVLAKLWKRPDLEQLQFRVNEHLVSTIARWVPSTDVIELSPSAARRRVRREVVCHEAAHRVVWERYGRRARPHGAEWRALVRAAGFDPKATLVRCGERHRRATDAPMFRHVCLVCQFSKRAKRRMVRWRCPECRAVGLEGILRIERVSVR